jgi:mevalonate kinase
LNKLDLLINFEALTESIIELDIKNPEVVERVEELISKRDQLILQIDAASGEISNGVLARIMQKNIQAETKLEEIMVSLKDGIEGVVKEKKLSSTKKKAHRGYLNPGHQNDGYFIDKKK